jgi:hypothetical protein
MFQRALKYPPPADPIFQKRIARWLYETRKTGRRLLVHDERIDDSDFVRILTFDEAQALYRHDLNPVQKFDQALLNINAESQRFGERILSQNHPFIVPSLDEEEQREILVALETEDLIRSGESLDKGRWVQLTHKGLTRASEIGQHAPSGKTVFVAASFAEELEGARKTIHEVIASLGYEPYLVNLDPHFDLIELKIYENIRRSRFVVADLTHNRQSVYYEAGFAHGLGLQVVLTCRADCFEDPNDDFKRVHFDLEHRPVLRWENKEELADILRKHLLMAFGRLS